MEKRISEALEGAVKFEEDGRTFFLAAAEKTGDKFGKKMFSGLADAELNHIERIKSIFETLNRTGKWPDAPSLFSPKLPARNIFEEAMADLDRDVRPTSGELEAVQLGIRYEEKGLKFYTGLSEEASHDLERKFYTQLGNEERGHFLLLKDMEAYYDDPVHWFSAKEKSHWDGA